MYNCSVGFYQFLLHFIYSWKISILFHENYDTVCIFCKVIKQESHLQHCTP